MNLIGTKYDPMSKKFKPIWEVVYPWWKRPFMPRIKEATYRRDGKVVTVNIQITYRWYMNLWNKLRGRKTVTANMKYEAD